MSLTNNWRSLVNSLHIFGLIFICLLMGCNKPSEKDIAAGRHKIEQVKAYLDNHIAKNIPIPQTDQELVKKYEADCHAPFPEGVHYGNINAHDYKLYIYVRMRTSLWYHLSNEEGDPGWMLDYDDGVHYESLP